jgi:hypothetical protein
LTEWPRERRAAHGGCVFGSTLLIPLGSRDRTLLVGVSHDGIDRKPFAADQPGFLGGAAAWPLAGILSM